MRAEPCLWVLILSQIASMLIRCLYSPPLLCHTAHKEWVSGLLSVSSTRIYSCLRQDRSGEQNKHLSVHISKYLLTVLEIFRWACLYYFWLYRLFSVSRIWLSLKQGICSALFMYSITGCRMNTTAHSDLPSPALWCGLLAGCLL